jgi:LysM repeat protein
VIRKVLLPVCLGTAALALAACGSSNTSSTSSVVSIPATNYHTIAPTPSTTTTTLAPGQTTVPGQTTTDVTDYTVQKGDVPFNVARKFSITLDALNQANAGTPGYSAFYPGLKIKIPAGAVIPTTLPPGATTTVATPAHTTTTLKGGGSNCPAGSYVIVAGDLPSTVAKKFNVTVAELDAANVNTPGYKNFVVGAKIVIPASNAKNCKG